MMKSKLTLLLVGVALVTGCEENEDLIRYPSVAIPQYELKDYLGDLSSNDSEQVYNAVIRLKLKTRELSKFLCGKEADPSSIGYQTSEAIYHELGRTVQSEQPYITAASLSCLQGFAKCSKLKNELVDIALQVQSDHPQVQYEQARLLSLLSPSPSPQVDSAILYLLKSKSWIVSRTAYRLVGLMGSPALRQDLVKSYERTPDVKERLLVVSALQSNLQPEEARFLEREMLVVGDLKLSRLVRTSLLKNLQVSGVRDWFVDRYDQFSKSEHLLMVKESADVELTCRFLAKGFVPPEELLTQYLKRVKGIERVEKQVLRENLLKLDRALSQAPQVMDRWEEMKQGLSDEEKLNAAIRADIKPVAEEFVKSLIAIHTKHGMTETEYDALLEAAFEEMEPIVEEFGIGL